jgi:hypothetical protein
MRPHGGQGGGAGSPCEQIVEEEPDPSSAVVGETEKSKLDATAGADEVGSLHMTPSVDVPSDAPRVCALALSVDAQSAQRVHGAVWKQVGSFVRGE